MAHFAPSLFRFLRELEENNTRDWFHANKPRYEAEVRGPALAFVGAMSGVFETLAPSLRADPRPSGGSLFRQHRDTRFSKDKSPYKTNVGITFRHEVGKMVSAPGFYLHLEPGGCFFGAGIYHPEREVLAAIRAGIDERATDWSRAVQGKTFRDHFVLGGSSLKRAPKGYDPEHPMIEDLRRKDFVAVHPLTQKQVTHAAFGQEFTRLCRAALPFARFLADSLELEF